MNDLTDEQIFKISETYFYLVDYDSNNPSSPINPMTYKNADGDTLLHIASSKGDLETVMLLLNAGLDPNLRGDMGYTAYHYALDAGQKAVADLLVE